MSDETAKNTEGTNHGAEPDYSEHFALTAKGKGCSGKLYGNVTLVAFLVHDRSSAWKDGDIDKIKSVLEKALRRARTGDTSPLSFARQGALRNIVPLRTGRLIYNC